MSSINEHIITLQKELRNINIPSTFIEEFLDNYLDQLESMKEEIMSEEKVGLQEAENIVLNQCDPIIGSRHFRTPISIGVDIISQLRGFTTGYAVPTYVVDAPGGGGKIPVSPDYIVSQSDGKYILHNYDGEEFIHRDPQ